MKILAGVLLLLVCVTRVDAQAVHGYVFEDSTRSPIHGARVELIAPSGSMAAAAVTDTAGAFLLRPQFSGNFTLRVSHPGWNAARTATISLGSKEILGIEIAMSRNVLPLQPVVVTTRRDPRLAGFYDRAKTGFASGQYMMRKEIEARPAARTTDLLRTMSGVEIIQGRGFMARSSFIAMRGGGGRCSPTIYIDGIVVRQLPESGLDDVLVPTALEGVEVYTRAGAGPGNLPARNSCGVVAFWTKSDMGEGRRWSWVKAASTVSVVALFAALLRY